MNRCIVFCLTLILAAVFSGVAFAQDFGDLKNITQIKTDVVSKRISSYDRSGGNNDRIEKIQPGEVREIFKVDGAGIITHIWITIDHSDRLSRRNIILRMYWDGETEPSVQSPIGDFFGQGWGEFYNFSSLPLTAAPGGGRSMTCYFPMPFGDGARITIENDSERQINAFYYYVDYEEHNKLPEDTGRFHAWWNHSITEALEGGENEWGALNNPVPNNTTGERNHVFMDTEGAGQFVGVNYYVNCPSPMWYGEGDDMFFIDGESWPSSLHGTGTEDYFNMSWCPKERFDHPYFGLARVNRESGWMGRTHCYRFHVQDPVRFTKSLRATIEHGHSNVLTLELSTTAYWYQTEPHKPFPAIPAREIRQPKRIFGANEIHRWRDAWRKSMGSGVTLWGDEQ